MIIIKEIIKLLRPQQWIKNTFVFLPLFFNGNIFNFNKLLYAIFSFLIFSIVSSSIYCFNDIWDSELDKLHPLKCKRPIASGCISKSLGFIIMLTMFVLSLLLCYLFFPINILYKIFAVVLFYFGMNIAYCIYLKQKALIDVFIIALGFVLRIVMGGVATMIYLSHWIILMTFLLALFLALAKRRDDVLLYEEMGVKMRKNINRYNLSFMNQSITIVATITLVSYIMYTVSDDIIYRFNNNYIYTTTIWVLLGILRYLQLTVVDVKSGSPTKVLIHDRFTQICIISWVMTFLIIIYF